MPIRKTLTGFLFATALATGGAQADPKPTSPGELRMEMRRVWEDQLVFTRNFIISTLEMSPDQGSVTEYFIQHQVALATALEPYYGAEAARHLTTILQQHVHATADLVRTISTGDVELVPRKRAVWVGNVNEIATYLATLNPRWNRKLLEAHLETYLALTMDVIAGRSIRNWETDLAAYERVRAHTTRFADFLSNGIIRQYPEKFR